MTLNYTTSTLSAKQREFTELYSEAILILDWAHTQVIFHLQLFNHKYEWSLLRFTLQSPTDTTFLKFRSHLCHDTSPWENHLSSDTKTICLRYPISQPFPVPLYPLMTQALKSLAHKAWELYSLWENGWFPILASVQFDFYPNAHTISSTCLLALSGRHVPGCSAQKNGKPTCETWLFLTYIKKKENGS